MILALRILFAILVVLKAARLRQIEVAKDLAKLEGVLFMNDVCDVLSLVLLPLRVLLDQTTVLQTGESHWIRHSCMPRAKLVGQTQQAALRIVPQKSA